MGATTTVRATSDVDWRMMFLKARQVVGIPDEQRFGPIGWDASGVSVGAASEPGGYDASVRVWRYDVAESPFPWPEEFDGPDGPCEVQFDTSPTPEDYAIKHARWVTELGAWLDSQGVS
jgi:hypothetical protein